MARLPIKGAVLATLIAVTASSRAHADPIRLRADAYAQTQSPVGLVVLRGEDRVKPWIDAEAVAWVAASNTPDVTGDVQTLTVRLRDPAGRGELRIGRFLFSSGAIRPLHLDGVRAMGRAPTNTTLELFAGSEVVPRFGARTFDLATGGRLSQTFGTYVSLGASYLLRRRDGQVLDREVGPDLAISPTTWLDFAGRMAFDLENPGPTDALASLGAHSKKVRVEAFVTHRSPGRMLPATSLFSVLGDMPSTTTGGTLRWRAAPRLDLLATGASVYAGGEYGGMGKGTALLALDDDWAGNTGIELRRQRVGDARWSGVRGLLSLPVHPRFRVSTELELVRPDDPRGGPRIWPWALVAMWWRMTDAWQIGAAAEALGGREGHERELHAMLHATWNWERPR